MMTVRFHTVYPLEYICWQLETGDKRPLNTERFDSNRWTSADDWFVFTVLQDYLKALVILSFVPSADLVSQ